jgi:ABC-type branched-subunit amino acid transport system ATPase component/branched-subunit amino acid ABC-type transport system permease component
MLKDLLPFIITGLLTGTVYGLLSTGLVLTFKTSGIFNFGQGALGTAGALLFYALSVSHGLDWKVGFLIAVFVLGPIMGLVMELVARHLTMRGTAWKVVGTVGLMVLIPSITLIAYPASNTGLSVDRFLPFSDRKKYKINVFDVFVFGDQIFVAAIAVLCVVALYLMFRFTRLGLAMRATVDDPDLLALSGTEPVRVRRTAWVVGCTFATLSGVLLLPSVNLQPFALTFLATYAFGAAAFGAFRSIPLAFVGGLVLGVAEDVSGFFIRREAWTSLGGLPEAMAFLILFVMLLVYGNRLRSEEKLVERAALPYRGPLELRLMVGVVVFGALALVPVLFESKLGYFTLGLCQAILILSLGLLVRTSGQLSLCHATFAAIGAVTFSQFTSEAGIPWLLALGLAMLVTIPVGALVALPAIRLSGVYLALATFGFGILVQRLIFPQTWMFATFAGSRPVPAPAGFDTPTRYYFLVLLVLAIVSILIAVIAQSRLGRISQGMGEAPTAVRTLGLSTSVTKMIVFCLSAGLAAVAGVMYGGAYHNIDSNTTPFQTFNSLVLIAILALAPFREPWYAVFAGLTAVIPGFLTGDKVPFYLNAMFGFFAILIAVQGGQPVMSAKLRAVFDRVGRRRAIRVPEHEPRPLVIGRQGLEVDGISVSFGGLQAVERLSLRAPFGQITGMIGPNGAGKTTTFNVISGINRNHRGTVRLDGEELSKRSIAQRGRLGLGRTFQRMDLADALTVFENVALGVEAGQAGRRVVHQVVAPSGERMERLAATHDALALCGITHLADAQAGSLSTGERRLVELARCLAGRFDLLLLDEPSSGLDRTETERFGRILRTIVESRGCGILLVEHDMSLVLNVCDDIYVLDFGRLIFHGTATEVASSELVRVAYLGEETTEIHAFEAAAAADGEIEPLEEQVG